MKEKKRGFFILLLGMLIYSIILGGFPHKCEEAMAAEVPPVKIGVIYPLSGSHSRNGNLALQGAKGLINWYNDMGGIKSLGGAKLVPVVADTPTSEKAAMAMERVSRDPEVLAVIGGWSSSFSMSISEVGERVGVPFFSGSFADRLSERGFKYGFYVAPPFTSIVGMGWPKVLEEYAKSGKKLKTAMTVGNNTAACSQYYEMGNKFFSNLGVNIVGSETWGIGTLTDATPIMQKVKTLDPDLIIYCGDAIAEVQMFVMKKMEMGLKRNIFLCGSGWMGDPSIRYAGEYLDSFLAVTPIFPHRLTPPEWIKYALEQCKKEYSDEPWVGQELGFSFNYLPVLIEAIERAGKRDRKAIRDTASKMELKNVMATRNTVKQGIAFREDGRVADKYQGVVIVQWQKGRPIAVWPPEVAMSEPTFGKL